MIDLDILDIGLTTDQKDKLKKYLDSFNSKIEEIDINNDLSFDSLEDKNYNIYSFDGLYDNCYIRLEENDVKELIKTLTKLYIK